ncbi:BcsR/BcsP family cellulose biosynthesis protein [Variovorax sp. LT1R16]|uniref:BcsR/BcsP family cellulose biosynthesis protein n=1 Tax=Variovorax sp. LT1R16 TaxID=3443728 RepID=UPI003F482218
MSADNRQQEDVAGLFRKFGGDATRYKEFAPAESPRTQGAWPLVNGTRAAAETATPPAPVQALAPAAAAPAAAPRALDALFARLAGATPPTPAAGQGLMSHWRRSG